MEGLATVLGGHAHMHMGRMEKKLVGNEWWKRGSNRNYYLGFLWGNKKRSKWSCNNCRVAMLMRRYYFMHAKSK